jgi:MraZ protein
MLRGNHPATVDQKGRLKIPADFVEGLAEYGEEFYVTSENGDHARVFPMRVWKEIEEKLARLSTHNVAKQKFLTRTNYFGQAVKMDGQGRILIGPVLREAAEMKGEVDVMGKLTYLEVWNHSRFLEHMKTLTITPDDWKALDDLGI